MSVIFGFTGPADHVLLQHLSHSLAHRGSHQVLERETPGGTLGCRAMWPSSTLDYQTGLNHQTGLEHQTGVGLAWDDQCSLMFCGYLTSPGVATAEVWLDQYKQRGISFAQGLRGAFVLAILDRDRLLLFRDGAGRRTVYHTVHRGRFVFAIEPKALYRMPGFSPRLRPGAVAQYQQFPEGTEPQ